MTQRNIKLIPLVQWVCYYNDFSRLPYHYMGGTNRQGKRRIARKRTGLKYLCQIDDTVCFTFRLRDPIEGSKQKFDPKELALEYYKFTGKVRRRIRDERRHLIRNCGCPVLLLIFCVEEDGKVLYFTKLLLLKSNFFVYAFYSGGRWKVFDDCPYTLVAEDNNIAEYLSCVSCYTEVSYAVLSAKDIDLSISELFYGKDDKKCRLRVLSLIFMFVESAKCDRIYQFVKKILCARNGNQDVSIRETWLITQWAKVSRWLYEFFAEGKWKIPSNINADHCKLHADKDRQIRKCMGTVHIIKRPSRQMVVSDLKKLEKFVFEFSTDSPGDSLVEKYEEFLSLVRSKGSITIMDINSPIILKFKMFCASGVVKKCSFLVFRENYEFFSIKVKGEWLNFFNSPYVLCDEHLNPVKRLDYYPTSFTNFSQLGKTSLISTLGAVLSGDLLQICCWAHLYFIFFGGAIFPEIQSFVCDAFLAPDVVEIEDYYFNLMRHWEDLSSYLHLKDKKKPLPRQLSKMLNLPTFDNIERQIESDEHEVRRLLAILHC